MAKVEKKEISPAIVIIPLGLGLGAAAVVGIAAMAKAAVTPTPTPGKATLYGKVTDSQTGAPLADVLLTLNGIQAYTDTEGNYTFSNIEPSAYTLTGSKSGWTSFSQAITLLEGMTQLNISMVPTPPPTTPPTPTPVVGYMPAAMTVEVTDGFIIGMYWRCKFSCPVTNQGNASAVFTLNGKDNLPSEFGGPRTWGPQQITLAPGETYLWSVEYDIDFMRVPSPYSWELWGDWPANNYSKGDARPENAVVKPPTYVSDITWDRSPLAYTPGEAAVVSVSVKNLTTKPFTYTGIIYIGTTQVSQKTFALEGGETQKISFGFSMPVTEGAFGASLSILVDNVVTNQVSLGSVSVSYSWAFTGSLSAVCVQMFTPSEYGCYMADISYQISNPSAPNFKWVLIYWNYNYAYAGRKEGNGPASGKVTCSGGAMLFAHPDPNAALGLTVTETGAFIQSGSTPSAFKLIASIGGHELGMI